MLIPLEKMTVPPRRQRWKMEKDKLNSLRDSIVRNGLLHAIIVRPIETQQGQIYQLVAGGRRLEAIKSLDGQLYKYDGAEVPVGHIAVTFLSDLSDQARMEAELEENIQRVDLTWQERTDAIANLNSLRQSQDPNHTQQDTAKELAELTGQTVKAAATTVSRDVILAKELTDPIIGSARSANEAYSIYSKRLQQQFETKLAEAKGIRTDHTLIVGDAKDELEKLSIDQFDCIIADPPYGIGADEFGEAGAAHVYLDTPEAMGALTRYIINRCAYLARPSAHLYLFCDVDFFRDLRDVAERAGWSVHRTPIIWYKGMGFDPYPGIGFRRSYEMLLYGWKGNKPHRGLMEDVLSVRGEQKEGHAASKPVDLYRKLLSRSCIPGDSILDPCCGSGTIFPAATSLSLKATGVEIDPNFAAMARARMMEQKEG
jgi:ParB/RepB/Spo0J family partition protein